MADSPVYEIAQSGGLPEKSKMIIWIQLVEVTGIHPIRLGELIEMGWIDPDRTASDDYLFSETDVYRIKRLVRVCRDFELSTLAGTIIVDLVDRIEQLEREVRELRRLL
jgi:hypothetical protein